MTARARALRLSWAVLGALAMLGGLARGGSAAGPAGVVVEKVARNSAAERAGLQPGDVIGSWSREAGPGTGPAAGGSLDSPFEMTTVEIEQAPRGPVTLRGRRGGADTTWTLLPGNAGLTARPDLHDRLLLSYREGMELAGSNKVVEGVERWRGAGVEAGQRGESLVAAWLLARAARALADARAWDQADAGYEEAVRRLEQEARPAGAAQVARDWGDTLRGRGQWPRAEETYALALALDRQLAAESLAAALNLAGMGAAAWSRGDFQAAEEHYRRALELGEKLAPGSLNVAGSLHGLGNVMWRRGDLPAAEQHYRPAAAIRERLAPGTFEAAQTINNLGNVMWRRGQLASAEEHYRKALAIREGLAPGGLEVAWSLDNLGLIAGERGDLAGAEDLHRRALEIMEKRAPASRDVAIALHNLGVIARERRDLAKADQYYRASLALREKLAPGSVEVAETLNNLGTVTMERGDLAAAAEMYRRSLEIKEKLAPGSLDVATTLNHLGEVAKASGDLRAAEDYCRRALAIREKLTPGNADLAESLHDLGLLQRQAGKPEEASRLLLQALDTLESQRTKLGGSEESRAGFVVKYAPYYHDAIEMLIELGRPAEALRVLERSRARSFLALLTERELLFAADFPPELARERRLVDAEYDRLQRTIAGQNAARDEPERQRLLARLRELRDEQEEIAGRIRRASPRFASLQYPEPLDLAGVRAALDPDAVFLAYSVGEKSTALFVVQPGGGPAGLSVHSIPVGAKALREKVEAFRSAIQRQPAAERRALASQGTELYDILVRPAEARIAARARLLVSPDGPLHSLPFGALARRGQGPHVSYLVEWKALDIVASATIYAEIKKSRRQAPASAGSLVAFGDPSYPRTARAGSEGLANAEVRSLLTRGFDLTPLPASRKEVEDIARLFPERVQKYLGPEATEERAKALGKEARYVHFACHGYLDERFPLNSALALTIPDAPSEDQDNGLLQAWEIFEKVRLDADLVTLSACETGLGKEMGGEGLLGLTRAFHYAGARSVLASLWAVSDESTALLMKRFYGYLKLGKARDEALRSAQIDLIRSPRPRDAAAGVDLAHPFHWAAFQLSGDWK